MPPRKKKAHKVESKSSVAEKSASDEAAELLKRREEQQFIRRQAYERRVFVIITFLAQKDKVAEGMLLKCATYLNPEDYNEVVEERSLARKCGYPLCSKSLLPDFKPNQKYYISCKANKVYDVTDRRRFCRLFCYQASRYLSEQLSREPSWERYCRPCPDLKLLQQEVADDFDISTDDSDTEPEIFNNGEDKPDPGRQTGYSKAMRETAPAQTSSSKEDFLAELASMPVEELSKTQEAFKAAISDAASVDNNETAVDALEKLRKSCLEQETATHSILEKEMATFCEKLQAICEKLTPLQQQERGLVPKVLNRSVVDVGGVMMETTTVQCVGPPQQPARSQPPPQAARSQPPPQPAAAEHPLQAVLNRPLPSEVLQQSLSGAKQDGARALPKHGAKFFKKQFTDFCKNLKGVTSRVGEKEMKELCRDYNNISRENLELEFVKTCRKLTNALPLSEIEQLGYRLTRLNEALLSLQIQETYQVMERELKKMMPNGSLSDSEEELVSQALQTERVGMQRKEVTQRQSKRRKKKGRRHEAAPAGSDKPLAGAAGNVKPVGSNFIRKERAVERDARIAAEMVAEISGAAVTQVVTNCYVSLQPVDNDSDDDSVDEGGKTSAAGKKSVSGRQTKNPATAVLDALWLWITEETRQYLLNEYYEVGNGTGYSLSRSMQFMESSKETAAAANNAPPRPRPPTPPEKLVGKTKSSQLFIQKLESLERKMKRVNVHEKPVTETELKRAAPPNHSNVSHVVRAEQRQIVMSRIMDNLDKMTGTLEMTLSFLSHHIRALVNTFNLDSNSIVLTPQEWIVVTCCILQMLCLKKKVIKKQVESWRPQQFMREVFTIIDVNYDQVMNTVDAYITPDT